MEEVLSIRIDAENENHHLWNNHGIWWCHYTVHPTAWTQRRVRRSLRTRDVAEARVRRDALFAGTGAGAGCVPGTDPGGGVVATPGGRG